MKKGETIKIKEGLYTIVQGDGGGPIDSHIANYASSGIFITELNMEFEEQECIVLDGRRKMVITREGAIIKI